MNKQEYNFIQTILAVVTDKTPPKCDNYEELIKIANFHGMKNMLMEIVNKVEGIPENLRSNLLETQMLLVIKEANQESEAEKLIRQFESNKIPVVMLKGWYLKRLYPRPDMRLMADTDIFIRQTDELKIHEITKEQGYKTVTFGGKKDNVYRKEPFCILEAHKNLFMYEDKWNELFNSKDSQMYIWNRIVKVDNYEYVYRMDDELFFVYMIAHIAKHLLDDGGIGVKAILDVWLFLREKTKLDFEIAYCDFDKLGIKEFAQKIVLLSQYWFEGKDPDSEVVKQLGDYILQCGIYGNSKFFVMANEIMQTDKKMNGFSYVFRRAFPTKQAMKTRFPQLEKKPWLLPGLYIKRLWYSVTKRTDAVKGEIRSAGQIDYEQVNKIHQLYKNIGLR